MPAGLEFDVADVGGQGIIDAFARHGCVVIRRAFDPEQLRRFRDVAVATLELKDQIRANASWPRSFESCVVAADSSTVDASVVYPQWKGLPLRILAALDEQIYETNWQRFNHDVPKMVLTSALIPFFKAWFKSRLAVPLVHCKIRQQSPAHPEGGLPYHQDAGSDPSQYDEPIITIWMPFDDCGVEAPGLEVYPYRVTDVWPTSPLPDTVYTFGIAPASLAEEVRRDMWHPTFAVGDCLLFTEMTVHRTYHAPGMTRSRVSADVRVCSSERPPILVKGTAWAEADPGD